MSYFRLDSAKLPCCMNRNLTWRINLVLYDSSVMFSHDQCCNWYRRSGTLRFICYFPHDQCCNCYSVWPFRCAFFLIVRNLTACDSTPFELCFNCYVGSTALCYVGTATSSPFLHRHITRNGPFAEVQIQKPFTNGQPGTFPTSTERRGLQEWQGESIMVLVPRPLVAVAQSYMVDWVDQFRRPKQHHFLPVVLVGRVVWQHVTKTRSPIFADTNYFNHLLH